MGGRQKCQKDVIYNRIGLVGNSQPQYPHFQGQNWADRTPKTTNFDPKNIHIGPYLTLFFAVYCSISISYLGPIPILQGNISFDKVDFYGIFSIYLYCDTISVLAG
jgi:hypothetical protein